ncbi:hypothetical protein [Terrabacter sp. NPDC080008]|uniref:hypothetical protein n=1 Tax=Terrabacter sp. NPDC080008 TaxID=3155176 RepID=UPI00344DFBCA
MGLLPWLVRRTGGGTFGTPWNPRNDLREALLPYHHQLLPLLLVVTVTAGVLAGLAPAWRTARRSHRQLLVAVATLGAAVATTWAVAQTLAPDPDLGGSGSTAQQVRLAFIGLTVAGSVVGLVLGLAVSLGGPALRVVAAASAVVVGADWVGQLVVGATRDASAATWLPTALAALSGAVVGALLAGTARSRVAARAAAWVGALGLLVLTAAALTAARYVLESLRGTRPRSTDLQDLLVDGTRVFRGSLSTTLTAWGAPLSPPLVGLVVAVVVGLGLSGLAVRAKRSATADERGSAD